MKRILLAVLAVIFIANSCNEPKNELHSLQGQAFGTTYSLGYFAEQPSLDLEQQLDSVFLAINQSVSTYLPNSDISKVNRGDSTLVVDAIFIYNYSLSKDIYEQSQGYFDPTVGALRNAYGFGDTDALKVLDATTIDSLRQMVGFDKVRLTDKNTIVKKHPGIYFDFNAVAKGYAVDRVANLLDRAQIENYLVEIGGEIVAKGINLDKEQAWTVGIEAVDSEIENRSLAARIRITNKAMASSGNYRKFRIDPVTGQKYVHTINPLTGSAAKSNVTSATVFAPSCAQADAYATSFMAMGIDRSIQLVENLSNIQVYLTYIDSLGTSQSYISESLKADLLQD
ncbi:MAG: FAD:protein FMN transferase [Gilvibacter sp.]